MKSFEQYKQELEAHIARLKANGGRTLYQMSLEMTRDTAFMLDRYFKALGYEIEVRMCPRGLWDVIIRF